MKIANVFFQNYNNYFFVLLILLNSCQVKKKAGQTGHLFFESNDYNAIYAGVPWNFTIGVPGYENKNLRVHIKPKGTITCKDGNYSVLIQYNDYQTRAISLEVYNKLNDRDSLLIGVKYYKILQLSDPVIYLSSKCKGQISCGELKFSNFIGAIQPADIMTGFRAKVTQYRALLITNNQGVQYFEAYSSKIPSPMKISMQNLSAGDKIIFFDVYCAFYRNSDFLFERKTDESLELTIKD